MNLRDHHEEIMPFMLSYLSNDLGSWIQKHRPTLTEDFEKTVKATVKLDSAQRIRSLLELEGDDILAAKRIREELEERGDLEALNFWLDELMSRGSREFEPVASDVIARAGQGQISFQTLFWISDIYLRQPCFIHSLDVVESAGKYMFSKHAELVLTHFVGFWPTLLDDGFNPSFGP